MKQSHTILLWSATGLSAVNAVFLGMLLWFPNEAPAAEAAFGAPAETDSTVAEPAPVQALWTEIIRFTPRVPSKKRDGECWTTSHTVEGAYRCSVNSRIYDPCYGVTDNVLDPYGDIVCGAYPGDENEAFHLVPTTPPPSGGITRGGEEPSGPSLIGTDQFILEGGATCHSMGGATMAWDEGRLNYSCDGGLSVVGDFEVIAYARTARLIDTPDGFQPDGYEWVRVERLFY